MVEFSVADGGQQAKRFHGFLSTDVLAALEDQAWKLADLPLFLQQKASEEHVERKRKSVPALRTGRGFSGGILSPPVKADSSAALCRHGGHCPRPPSGV